MSDTDPTNSGPGWGDHDTPYGPIHSYTDPGTVTAGGHAGKQTNIGPQTTINIPTAKSYNGVYMSMCVTNLKNHEGFVNNIYADGDGNPTVGIGHLLANIDAALALPFRNTYHQSLGHGDSNNIEQAATVEQIKNSYNQVKGNPKARASVHLTNDYSISLCIKDVQVTETGLRNLYSGFDAFPNSAKTALIDMGFNLGLLRLSRVFTKFNAAVNRKDWAAAAEESHRTKIQESRNVDTRNQLIAASQGK